MRFAGLLIISGFLLLPGAAFAVDVPELPMKIYGTVTGEGVVEAYVGDEVLASTVVANGTVGYAPNLFLIPGTVPEGTTVVLKANNKELERFAFERGGSREVSFTIPSVQPSVAAAAMIIVDQVVSGASDVLQASVSTITEGFRVVVENVVERPFAFAQSLFSGGTQGGEGSGSPENVPGEPEREGFVTFTGSEEPRNNLAASALDAVPEGVWPWVAGVVGLIGIGGLAFVRFRG
jgi:hypothetical protein